MSMPGTACGPQVRVVFSEDSPDRFLIEFVHGPKRQLKSLSLNLSTSWGRAYVDTNYGQSKAGQAPSPLISSVNGFAEGGDGGTLEFENFPEGARLAYLVDLDVRISATRDDYDHVSSEEIEGATASAVIIAPDGRRETIHGRFTGKGEAVLGPKACV